MKKIFVILSFLFLSSAFANVQMDDNMFRQIAQIASVKTDLFFCFKGALGGQVSGDDMLDTLIFSSCDQKMNEALSLGISEEEILEVAAKAEIAIKKARGMRGLMH